MAPATGDPAPSNRHLVRRYLEGFGPATAAVVSQFTFLRKPAVVAAIEALARDGEVEVDGKLLDVPGGLRPDEDTPAPPRLLAMWDSVLLAYADRSRVIPDEHRAHVIRRNGDVLPTLLVDGRVVGVWRPDPADPADPTDPAGGRIEATAFEPLSDDAWAGLAAEAAALHRFLADRDPAVYRRHWRWWDTLPSVDVRVLR